MIEYRNALSDETNKIKTLLWEHGPNQWNHLTEKGVDDELSLIRSDSAVAAVAVYKSEIIGFSILIDGNESPDYLKKYCSIDEMCFISDVVVSSHFSGKGIATQLLKNCIEEAKNRSFSIVLIERHEQNLASAGMMRKAGFSIIDTFYDPDKRTSGSRNSVILEVNISQENRGV
ncbi:MAG: GNAT family N-acetyltransferase [bacterium]